VLQVLVIVQFYVTEVITTCASMVIDSTTHPCQQSISQLISYAVVVIVQVTQDYATFRMNLLSC
jgi:hypothetical protein